MIKALYWNCRGIANSPTIWVLANLVQVHSPDIIFISEPMTPFSSTHSLHMRNFGFDIFYSNAPHPANPKLWCFYKSTHHLTISLSDSSSQHLTMLLTNPTSGPSTLITGVYGSTNHSQRRGLWKVLIDSSSTTLPWCVLGDFNAILSHEDKLSIRQANPSSLKDFQSVVMLAGLQDINFSGNKYTWSNNMKGLSYVAARLDRALVNHHWLATYSDPLVLHLARISLDHSPILLDHKNPIPTPKCPFQVWKQVVASPILPRSSQN